MGDSEFLLADLCLLKPTWIGSSSFSWDCALSLLPLGCLGLVATASVNVLLKLTTSGGCFLKDSFEAISFLVIRSFFGSFLPMVVAALKNCGVGMYLPLLVFNGFFICDRT